MNEPKQIDEQQAANILGRYSRKQQTGDQSDYGFAVGGLPSCGKDGRVLTG